METKLSTIGHVKNSTLEQKECVYPISADKKKGMRETLKYQQTPTSSAASRAEWFSATARHSCRDSCGECIGREAPRAAAVASI